MKKKYLLILLSLIIVSCVVNYGIQTKEFKEKNENREGLSYENAIIILRTDEKLGIQDEYEYLKSKYPNCKLILQTIDRKWFSYYDIMEIETVDSVKITIYFDIDHFYKGF